MCRISLTLVLAAIAFEGRGQEAEPSFGETVDYLNAKLAPCEFRNTLVGSNDATEVEVSGKTPVLWSRDSDSRGHIEEQGSIGHRVLLPLAQLTSNVVIDVDNGRDDDPEHRGLARMGVKAIVRVNCRSPECSRTSVAD